MTSTIFSSGIAIFAMLFGAGNLVYPLALGRFSGDMVGYALIGFCLTAIVVPLIGLIGAMLFDGDYNSFFDRLGNFLGKTIVFICMIFLAVGIARIITVSHGAVYDLLQGISLVYYAILACCVILAATYRRAKIVDLLGFVLGPTKIVMISIVIIKGLMTAKSLVPAHVTVPQAVLEGFSTGYLTLDLIGTLFFSGLIVLGIKTAEGQNIAPQRLATIGALAGLLGGMLIAVVYCGLSLVAAMHADVLCGIEQTKILPAIACLALGERASMFVNITVAVACMTTAIVLTAVFADYLKDKAPALVRAVTGFSCSLTYVQALLITLVAVFAMAILGFDELQGRMIPVVQVLYPVLLVTSLCNIAYKFVGLKAIGIPVVVTLCLSLGLSLWSHFSGILLG